VVTLGGRWYGLPVTHPFLDLSSETDDASDTDGTDSDELERAEDAKIEAQIVHRETSKATMAEKKSRHAVYRETRSSLGQEHPILTISSFSADV
jgi:hypothetical protein